VLRQFGGAQFSAFKPALVDLSVAKLGPVASEMKRLLQDVAYIDSVLAEGSSRASAVAAETMKSVKDIIGFVHN
jgi:tryptophanyl-tRNA synthetase